MAEEIKSSFELAMEKLAKLPRLSEQEFREQQEAEYRPKGEGLANRYLAGEVTEAWLAEELHKAPAPQGEIIRRGYLSLLCRSIPPYDPEAARKALLGIRVLLGEGALADTFERLSRLAQEYAQRREHVLDSARKAELSRLRDLGVSGSAVRVDLRDSQAWAVVEEALRRELDPQAEQLRAKLLDEALEAARTASARDG